MSKDQMCGYFFFAERTISGFINLDMLENYLIPQLQDMEGQVIFQQDGVPPHFHTKVRQFLDTTFPEWIGRGGTIACPPRSPDLTPLDFHLRWYVKDQVYVLTFPQTLDLLRDRIVTAVASVDRGMLQRVWDEISYRWDICCVSQGSHIEHL
jgi:hypothetical protein